jgi:uncharacterized protein (DUF305 family)
MNNQTIIVVIIALLFGGVGGYLVAQSNVAPTIATDDENNSIPAGMHRMPDGSLMHHENTTSDMGMMNGMDHSMMMVESEREFIEGMIPHHQEAVDTAKEVIERGGTTAEIRELVENIVIAQEREIADMKAWYKDWYGEEYVDNGDYMPMMRALDTLSGAPLDRVFLEDMIMHHM